MKIERSQITRIVVVYLLAMPVMWQLSGWVYPAYLLTYTLSHSDNPITTTKTFLTQQGYKQGMRSTDVSPRDRDELMVILANQMLSQSRKVTGFWPTILMSVLVFGSLGLSVGFCARVWEYAVCLPVVSVFMNNPMATLKLFHVAPLWQRIVIFVFAQVGISYLFTYLGVFLYKNRSDRKAKQGNIT